jgi:hypothetical protein
MKFEKENRVKIFIYDYLEEKCDPNFVHLALCIVRITLLPYPGDNIVYY